MCVCARVKEVSVADGHWLAGNRLSGFTCVWHWKTRRKTVILDSSLVEGDCLVVFGCVFLVLFLF